MIAERGFGSLLLLASIVAGCGADGATPSCEDYPLPYDVRIPARRAEVWEKLSGPASDPNYCTIVPAGYAPGSGGAGQSGSGGTAGAPLGGSGDGGLAGSGGDGGLAGGDGDGTLAGAGGDGAGGSPE